MGRRRVQARAFILGAICAASLLLAACSKSPAAKSGTSHTTTTLAATTTTTTTVPPATTSTAAAATGPACSMAAITAGIPQQSPDYGTLQKVTGYGCSGVWAYADIVSGTAQSSTDGVVILQASGTSWTLADRAAACNGGQLPPNIQQFGCTTS